MAIEVLLRDVKESDLPIFFDQQLDREATRMAAFPSRERDAFMAHWAKSMAEKTASLQTIIFDGRVVGNIVCWEQSGNCNVGYWIGREYWGRGIASAALLKFLGHVTVRPLVARAAKHNVASVRVLQKCGFTISGEDRFLGADGEWVEEYILTLDRVDTEYSQEAAEHDDAAGNRRTRVRSAKVNCRRRLLLIVRPTPGDGADHARGGSAAKGSICKR